MHNQVFSVEKFITETGCTEDNINECVAQYFGFVNSAIAEDYIIEVYSYFISMKCQLIGSIIKKIFVLVGDAITTSYSLLLLIKKLLF